MTNNENLIYDIALTLVPGFGPVTIKKTLASFKSAKNFFEQKEKDIFSSQFILKNNPIKNFKSQLFSLAEQELNYCFKNNIQIISYNDENYPRLLKEIYDAPYILYVKGELNLNKDNSKPLSIVGTRKATQYGKTACNNVIAGLKQIDGINIISGLAIGIDTCAHKSSLENNIPTIAVLGHGFRYLYPAKNKKLAKEIIEKGGAIITEYTKDTSPDSFNFVKRNRIISGLSEGTVIVESDIKGGALITANLAFSYNREVMAIPGRISDNKSRGCNLLIKQNKATLINDAQDIIELLNWDLVKTNVQKKANINLTKEEKSILDVLKTNGKTNINTLSKKTGIELSILSFHLINLEMKSIVKSLPGNFYEIF